MSARCQVCAVYLSVWGCFTPPLKYTQKFLSARLYAFDCYRYPGYRECAVHYGERDAANMNELGNYDRKRSKFYF